MPESEPMGFCLLRFLTAVVFCGSWVALGANQKQQGLAGGDFEVSNDFRVLKMRAESLENWLLPDEKKRLLKDINIFATGLDERLLPAMKELSGGEVTASGAALDLRYWRGQAFSLLAQVREAQSQHVSLRAPLVWEHRHGQGPGLLRWGLVADFYHDAGEFLDFFASVQLGHSPFGVEARPLAEDPTEVPLRIGALGVTLKSVPSAQWKLGIFDQNDDLYRTDLWPFFAAQGRFRVLTTAVASLDLLAREDFFPVFLDPLYVLASAQRRHGVQLHLLPDDVALGRTKMEFVSGVFWYEFLNKEKENGAFISEDMRLWEQQFKVTFPFFQDSLEMPQTDVTFSGLHVRNLLAQSRHTGWIAGLGITMRPTLNLALTLKGERFFMGENAAPENHYLQDFSVGSKGYRVDFSVSQRYLNHFVFAGFVTKHVNQGEGLSPAFVLRPAAPGSGVRVGASVAYEWSRPQAGQAR